MIDEKQFGAALAAAMLTKDNAKLREAAGSGVSKSYYVVYQGRIFPLKAITRLAYKQSKLTWDGPQSEKVARLMRPHFTILHITAATERKRLERQREDVNRWSRDGRFRIAVLDLYQSTCVISGCTALDAIDAAHICGVGEEGDDLPENGIVLRADLHRLFDAGKMSINPKGLIVQFDDECAGHYGEFEGTAIELPKGGPKAKSFKAHWKKFQVTREM